MMLEILQELSKCNTETQVSKCYWKNSAATLIQHKVATRFQFVKNTIICEAC